MRIHSFTALLISSLLIISGCNSGGGFSTTSKPTSDINPDTPAGSNPDSPTGTNPGSPVDNNPNTPPDTAKLHSLVIKPASEFTVVTTPQEMFASSSLRLKVTGTYDNGSTYDITDRTKITSDNDTVVSVNGNLVKGLVSGTANLSAETIEYTGIPSAAYQVKVLSDGDTATINSGVCGKKLNDSTYATFSSPCLKLFTDDKGNWFTSSPSRPYLEAQGFTTIISSDVTIDRPYKTYSGLRTIGSGQFGRFLQRYPENFENSQYKLWCDFLNDEKFAGKSNWDRVTSLELNNLVSYRGRLQNDLYWPATQMPYHTKTIANNTGSIAIDGNGIPGNLTEQVVNSSGLFAYASCVSRGNN